MGPRRGPLVWLREREVGHEPCVGRASQVSNMLYNSVQVTSYWDPNQTPRSMHHGGIFNFDFSTDGSMLVAACEKKSFLVFDPFNGKLVAEKTGAHSDCVNCVRFLDTRTFATCSDDTTVALWDLRCLRNKIRSLQGHSNWVKNIEYASTTGQLVTSGFDGTIYSWDINNYSDQEGRKRVFYASGLMRSKLTPDDSKLVIATAGGYLMIIHNLDLENLHTDMEEFKPHMYRLMQISGKPVATATAFNHMFERRRNRVELIGDFPKLNKAEVIASLQVHPQGWCVASRNTSADEVSEWTCVHDIQDQPLSYKQDNSSVNLDSLQQATAAFPSQCMPSSTDAVTSQSQSQVREDVAPASVPTHISSYTNWSPVVSVQPSSDSRIRTLNEVEEGNGDREEEEGEEEEENNERGDGEWDEIGLFANPSSSSPSSSDENSGDDDIWLGRVPLDLWGTDGLFSRFLFGGRSGNGERDSPAEPPSEPAQPVIISGLDQLNSLLSATHQELQRLGSARHGTSQLARQSPDAEAANPNSPINTGSVNHAASSSSSTTSREYGERLLSQLLLDVRDRTRRNIARRVLLNPNRRHSSNQPLLQRPSSGSQSQGFIHPIKPRLLCYLREPNVGRGYIKEPCFSTDGRLIVSPFGNGVRLLSFDSSCHELCDTPPISPNQPRPLHELRSVAMHANVALTTRFSPTHLMFVSGSLDGSVAFLQPYQ